MVEAVAGSYYPRLVSSADGARARAQSAYAIASVLAGALVGATLVTTFATSPLWVRSIGFAAVVVWIAGSLLYVRAVASPLAELEGDIADGSDWVREVVEAARRDRTEIDRRGRLANLFAVAALALTATAFAGVLFGSEPRIAASVVLTQAGSQQLEKLCGASKAPLRGEVTTASLNAGFVVIHMKSGKCRGTLRLSSSLVSIVASG